MNVINTFFHDIVGYLCRIELTMSPKSLHHIFRNVSTLSDLFCVVSVARRSVGKSHSKSSSLVKCASASPRSQHRPRPKSGLREKRSSSLVKSIRQTSILYIAAARR